MKNKEEPYNYIYLTAFQNMLKYGDKNNISIEKLIEYKNRFLTRLKDYKKIVDNTIINYEKVDDLESIGEFLSNYDTLFYEEDDKIFLYDETNYDEIDEAIMCLTTDKEEYIDVYKLSSDSIQLLKIIGATHTHDMYELLLKNELEMEKAYIDYYNNPNKNTKFILDNYMFSRLLLFKMIEKLPAYKIEALRDTALEKESTLEDDFEYDEIPYSEEIWHSVKHINDLDIEELLYSLNHYSIYSEFPLYYKKLSEQIEPIYLSSVKDEIGLFDEIAQKKKETDFLDYLFYLKYIDNINKYLDKTRDDNLLESKHRLIYSLDNPNICIYDEKNLEKEIEYVNNINIDSKELDIMHDEVIFLIGELFIEESEFYTSQKLLLIKTYYDLTHDEEIEEFFDGFKPCKNYDIYKEVVFGKNKVKKI